MNNQIPFIFYVILFAAITVSISSLGIAIYSTTLHQAFSDGDVWRILQDRANRPTLNLLIDHPDNTYDDASIKADIQELKEADEDLEKGYNQGISDVRRLLDERYPIGSGQPDDTSQTGMGTQSPVLTINLETDIYYAGDTITISGMAVPSSSVEAIITRPDLVLQGGHSPADKNGEYTIAYWAKVGYPLGTYQVKVKSQNQFSELLTFTLK